MPTPTFAQRGPLKKCQGQGWVCTICPATHGRGRRFFSNLKAALNHERTTHDHGISALKEDDSAVPAGGIGAPNSDHLRTTDETCWDEIAHPRLTSEGLRQWEMHAHVDHVYDMVPFWQRGIDAAEKGEILRLEEFLEKMEGDGGWRTANEVLGMLGGWKVSPSEQVRDLEWGQHDWAVSRHGAWDPAAFGWPATEGGGWGTGSARIASDATESSDGEGRDWGIREKWAEDGSDVKNDDWSTRVKTMAAVGGSGGRAELHHFADVIARQEAVNETRRKEMHLFFEMPMEKKIQKIEETIRFLRAHAARY